jgi:integrase
MRFLTHDQARGLLSELAKRSMDTHDEALVSLFCGLRAGEIHNLRWNDVNLENRTLFIREPKNKRNRHAFFPNEVQAMLERRAGKQAKNAFVFPATNGKQRQWISAAFTHVVDALGLNNSGEFVTNEAGEKVPVKLQDARQRVVFHTLRHSFASWLAQNGTSMPMIAELMGHSSLQMSQRYAHLSPDTLRKAAASLEGILERKPAKVSRFARKA